MIKSIRLKNFKSWRDTGVIKLAPINLILGTNSSGKSSLLQSLLLLKQTAFSADRTIHLNLGGDELNDYIDLGSFRTLLHNGAKEHTISLDFEFSKTRLEVTYKKDASQNPTIESLLLSNKEKSFKAQRRERGAYSIYLNDEALPIDKSRLYSPERTISFSADAVAAYQKDGADLQDISLSIRRELESIHYLGPLRMKAQRDYSWNKVRPGVMGDDGRNMAYILASSAQAAHRRSNDEIVNNVSDWLNRMNLADKLEIKQDGQSGHFRINLLAGKKAINLRDVGIGVSQVLPVIVLSFFVPKGSIILLEEPEIHLHPLAQAELAEMIASVALERELQFLVETHSEHLFRRLQTIISRETIKPDDCALYFVEHNRKESNLLDLDADAYGRIQNWPKYFFGNAIEETRLQMEYAIKRRAKNGI
jgi:predicted ATPase